MDKRRSVLLAAVFMLAVPGLGRYFYLQRNLNGFAASGTIEGIEVTVSSKTMGRVAEIKAEEGSTVSKGEVLATLEAKELEEALRGARARFKIAESDFDRSKELFADKMISPQQYDMASSNVEIASAALETAKLQLENTVIKAPVSGVILVKAIEEGELAAVGAPIVTMADLRRVKLTVYLAEKDIGKVKLGEEVFVSVDSYPGEKFTGRLVYISDQAEFTPKSIQTREERTTEVFAVKIEILNANLKLKPGMPADAEFKWNSR